MQTFESPSAVARLRGLGIFGTRFLGLAPQALCFRLLRRLVGWSTDLLVRWSTDL